MNRIAKRNNEVPECAFTKMQGRKVVQCDFNDRHCESCAWNPVVDRARKADLPRRYPEHYSYA